MCGMHGHIEKELSVTNGILSIRELEENGRLYGEIAYYRRWSQNSNQQKPSEDVTDDLNSIYDGDINYIPRGVEDLYIIDNKKLGIKSNKTYIIDATNNMIYSLNGYNLDGYDVHSLNMYEEIQGRDIVPSFASIEVSGAGDDIIYAGSEYLTNKDGEYVDENGNVVSEDDRIVNENGFRIISNNNSSNVYKLYNNGDLYAKGVKGIQMNTPNDEMIQIETASFFEFKIPNQVKECKKAFLGEDSGYAIDKNDILWAWGSNSNNKFGLKGDDLSNYVVGSDVIKVGLPENVVASNLFDMGDRLFVISTDDKLYAMGANDANYGLGIGQTNSVSEFQEITLPNNQSPSKIKYITTCNETTRGTIIACEDGKFYACGSTAKNFSGFAVSGAYEKWSPILDGYVYKLDKDGNVVEDNNYPYNKKYDIDNKVKKIVGADARTVAVLDNDGNLYRLGISYYYNNFAGDREVGKYRVLTKIDNKDYGTNISDIFQLGGNGILVYNNSGELWVAGGKVGMIGSEWGGQNTPFKKVDLPKFKEGETIKEVIGFEFGIYLLTTNNRLFGIGTSGTYFGLENKPEVFTEFSLPSKVISLSNMGDVNLANRAINGGKATSFRCESGIYSISKNATLKKDITLQKSWIKINPYDKAGKLVKIIDVAFGDDNRIAVIDDSKNMWVAGNSSNCLLGMGVSGEKVSNFTRIENDLIMDKVKKVCFQVGAMYVLTEDKKLFSTGIWSTNGTGSWPNCCCPGWEEHENHYDFQLILEEVEDIDTSNRAALAKKNNELYEWGFSPGGNVFLDRVPKALMQTYIETTNFDFSEVSSLFGAGQYTMCFTTSSGKLFFKSNVAENNYQFCYNTNKKYVDISTKVVKSDEKVIDVKTIGMESFFFLTDKGNLYGFGNSKYLGIGSSENVKTDSPIFLLDNVSQFSCGDAFCIAVKKDGTVWGTGSNANGVLGRWRDSDRTLLNSRYRTPYIWVECPELEL